MFLDAGKQPKRYYFLVGLISLALAFWVRWQFVQKINLYPDEFVTLLAMDMIAQKGLPILPSGLFYEHGLLYSYLAGGVALLGEPAILGRLTSLVLGLVTIILTYQMGRRWFSPAVGILAAVGLVLAPVAIQWHGRVRMYALLQCLVLLSLYFILESGYHQRPKAAWWAILSYFGALLTQFVSIALLPPLMIAEMVRLQTQSQHKRWYAEGRLWRRGAVLIGVVLVTVLIKRAGQPKGIEPLEAGNAVAGIWQVFSIYSAFSLEIQQSWTAISPFFLELPSLAFSLCMFVAVAAALWYGEVISPETGRRKRSFGPSLFLACVLFLTTVEMIIFAPADRRDDKYLFMLLPVLLLLGGQGMVALVNLVGYVLRLSGRAWYQGVAVSLLAMALFFYAQPGIAALLADVGEDYSTTFEYVSQNLAPEDKILTGTPAAAYHYLGRNDYYAVQAGGSYDYRILYRPGQTPVERWLGSPWIHSVEALHAILSQERVWFVLERWGLLIQYYRPLFMQNILAQTEFIREDNGIIALRSVPDPQLLQESPAVPAEAVLSGTEGDPGQLKLRGYSLEETRLTLYWETVIPLSFDYTVFVNIQNGAGETILQTDHRPLGSIYPTTLWPVGEVIRETSRLDLPPGDYELRAGMYRLETGERLWVPSDETLQNMVYLGQFQVP